MVKKRCGWCGEDGIYVDYHDHEWGVPLRDTNKMFELLSLEGMQAGLSWLTVLKKRDRMRKVFDAFDPERVRRYGASKIQELMQDAGIIRHRGKIEAVINNAHCYLELSAQQAPAEFFWSFVEHEPRLNRWKTAHQVPAFTETSEALSNALKARGFRFVGPRICYAFMQSAGLVNDHLTSCFRYQECASTIPGTDTAP